MSAAAPEGATAATSAPWYSVEQYYLRLLNCTRTGGWVQTDGTCVGYGTGKYSTYVPPFKYSANLSTKVARYWAKRLAVTNTCKHGDPASRLRAAGYDNWTWGENIGCYDVRSAYASVLSSHLAFQREKSTNGGHWKNIKNRAFRAVGIGVWKYNGHTRLVTDFYTP